MSWLARLLGIIGSGWPIPKGRIGIVVPGVTSGWRRSLMRRKSFGGRRRKCELLELLSTVVEKWGPLRSQRMFR
jgi:hypothetical protein